MMMLNILILGLASVAALAASLPRLAAIGGLALVGALVLGSLLAVLFHPVEYTVRDEFADWREHLWRADAWAEYPPMMERRPDDGFRSAADGASPIGRSTCAG